MADDEKTFTQADVDKLMADLNTKHQEDMNALAGKLRAEFKDKEAKAKSEAEKLAKQANMSELEKANAELADWKVKYQEKEDLINLSTQKDETRKLMKEMGVDESCLDFCFIPKDTDGTKARIQAFKDYTDGVKKATFENGMKSTIPNKGKEGEPDPFLEGFESGSIK